LHCLEFIFVLVLKKYYAFVSVISNTLQSMCMTDCNNEEKSRFEVFQLNLEFVQFFKNWRQKLILVRAKTKKNFC